MQYKNPAYRAMHELIDALEHMENHLGMGYAIELREYRHQILDLLDGALGSKATIAVEKGRKSKKQGA